VPNPSQRRKPAHGSGPPLLLRPRTVSTSGRSTAIASDVGVLDARFMTDERRRHWDDAYAKGVADVSWYQAEPRMSLHMLDSVGVDPSASVVDVGGGASPLVDVLVQRGFGDVTVVDLSTVAVEAAQARLGADATDVRWCIDDVLGWRPGRRFDVWHDRAVFHFLTDDVSQQRYVDTLTAVTDERSLIVLATFAPSGPQTCSGLPVARYDAAGLGKHLGDAWTLVRSTSEDHLTPWGTVQPFTWAAFRRSLRDTRVDQGEDVGPG